jgi:hypothetical protein
MTQAEKLERLQIIIGIQTKMKRSTFYYLLISIGLSLWFMFLEYPDFISYLPIGAVTLVYVGFMGYLYNNARVSLNKTYQKYEDIEKGDSNGEY